MTDTSITPPIVLARKARHRKPNRRRGVIKAALGSFFLAAAVGGSITAAAAAPQTPAFYGLTPGQFSQVATTLEAPGYQLTADVQHVAPSSEAHACHLAVVLHEHRLQGAPVPASAVAAVKSAARKADSELGGFILRYVRTDRGWVAVVGACNPDAPVGQP